MPRISARAGHVVVGNIIARGNPELEEVLDRKIPYRSLPEMLEEIFLPGNHSIVVSGTHGKTTTTAMLAWIFHTAGRKPNFLVGGVAENFDKQLRARRRRRIHSGRRRVRDSFLGSRPKIFPLSSRRFDHHFAGVRSRRHLSRLRHLSVGVQAIVNLVPRSGRIVIWGDTDDSGPRCGRGRKSVLPGRDVRLFRSNDWIASDVPSKGETMRFRVTYRGKTFGEFDSTAAGRHNVLNALAAMAVAHGRGIAPKFWQGACNIPQRQAPNGCERRVRRRSGSRRFRASSDRGTSHDRSCARSLAQATPMGHPRAAIELHATQSISGNVAASAARWLIASCSAACFARSS